MKNKEEELGKALKRKAINRANEEEREEEIKEYIYNEDKMTDVMVSTGLINRYDDV